jgi:hypothetical protein
MRRKGRLQGELGYGVLPGCCFCLKTPLQVQAMNRKRLLSATAAFVGCLALTGSVLASVTPHPLGGPYVPESAPSPPSTISPYYGGPGWYYGPGYYPYSSRWYYQR